MGGGCVASATLLMRCHPWEGSGSISLFRTPWRPAGFLLNRCSLGGYRSQVSARFSDDAGYRQSSRRQFSDSRTASLYRPALQRTMSSRGRRLPPPCSGSCNVFQFYRRFLATSWGSACYPNTHPTSQSEPRRARLLISPHKAPNEAVHRPCSAAFAAMQRWPTEELKTPVIYGVHPVE